MMKDFSTLFSPLLSGDLPEPLMKGKILRIQADKTGRSLDIQVGLEALVARSALTYAEQQITEKLGVNRTGLHPRYPSALFTSEYLPELIPEIKRQGALVNGFFDDAHADYLDGTLRIYLSHGGYDILKKIGCDRMLRQVIQEEFSLDVVVEFDGVLELSQEERDSIAAIEPPPEGFHSLPPDAIPLTSGKPSASAEIPGHPPAETVRGDRAAPAGGGPSWGTGRPCG